MASKRNFDKGAFSSNELDWNKIKTELSAQRERLGLSKEEIKSYLSTKYGKNFNSLSDSEILDFLFFFGNLRDRKEFFDYLPRVYPPNFVDAKAGTVVNSIRAKKKHKDLAESQEKLRDANKRIGQTVYDPFNYDPFNVDDVKGAFLPREGEPYGTPKIESAIIDFFSSTFFEVVEDRGHSLGNFSLSNYLILTDCGRDRDDIDLSSIDKENPYRGRNHLRSGRCDGSKAYPLPYPKKPKYPSFWTKRRELIGLSDEERQEISKWAVDNLLQEPIDVEEEELLEGGRLQFFTKDGSYPLSVASRSGNTCFFSTLKNQYSNSGSALAKPFADDSSEKFKKKPSPLYTDPKWHKFLAFLAPHCKNKEETLSPPDGIQDARPDWLTGRVMIEDYDSAKPITEQYGSMTLYELTQLIRFLVPRRITDRTLKSIRFSCYATPLSSNPANDSAGNQYNCCFQIAELGINLRWLSDLSLNAKKADDFHLEETVTNIALDLTGKFHAGKSCLEVREIYTILAKVYNFLHFTRLDPKFDDYGYKFPSYRKLTKFLSNPNMGILGLPVKYLKEEVYDPQTKKIDKRVVLDKKGNPRISNSPLKFISGETDTIYLQKKNVKLRNYDCFLVHGFEAQRTEIQLQGQKAEEFFNLFIGDAMDRVVDEKALLEHETLFRKYGWFSDYYKKLDYARSDKTPESHSLAVVLSFTAETLEAYELRLADFHAQHILGEFELKDYTNYPVRRPKRLAPKVGFWSDYCKYVMGHINTVRLPVPARKTTLEKKLSNQFKRFAKAYVMLSTSFNSQEEHDRFLDWAYLRGVENLNPPDLINIDLMGWANQSNNNYIAPFVTKTQFYYPGNFTSAG